MSDPDPAFQFRDPCRSASHASHQDGLLPQVPSLIHRLPLAMEGDMLTGLGERIMTFLWDHYAAHRANRC